MQASGSFWLGSFSYCCRLPEVSENRSSSWVGGLTYRLPGSEAVHEPQLMEDLHFVCIYTYVQTCPLLVASTQTASKNFICSCRQRLLLCDPPGSRSTSLLRHALRGSAAKMWRLLSCNHNQLRSARWKVLLPWAGLPRLLKMSQLFGTVCRIINSWARAVNGTEDMKPRG